MSEERLQKLLARAGVASRRKSEELIASGRVTINGRVATVGDKVDPSRDSVKVDGRRVQPQTSFRYLLLNKPRAVMSTVSDPEGRPTVIDLIPPALRKALVPVGRLDFLSEGLLLLTDDGDLANKVGHPRYGCTKSYEVKVKGEPKNKDVDRLRTGILLDGRRTAPAQISRRQFRTARGGRKADPDAGNTWWRVEIGEGRHRQIREMFQRIGHPVVKLRRTAIGAVSDPQLRPGEFRELREQEVEALRTGSPPPRRRPPRAAGSARGRGATGTRPGAADRGKRPRSVDRGRGGAAKRGGQDRGGQGRGGQGRGGKSSKPSPKGRR